MLNRADTQYEAQEKMRTTQAEPCGGARELTVGELIDRRILKQHLLLKNLQDLRNNLPASFLDSGASRIGALLEP